MKCPYCGHSDDRVLDTRDQKEGEQIRRRRECLSCRARFTTVEILSVSYPFIAKKDSRREPFSKEKVMKGIQAACQKRAISQDQIQAVVDRVSNWVIGLGEQEVPSRLIGRKVMMELKRLDDVAYVRFASVYRTFKDVQEFVETLEDQADAEVYDPATQLTLTTERSFHATTSPRTRPSDPVSN